MTLFVSTGFKSRILGAYSFESIFDGGCIEVYSNPTQPVSADHPPVGILLGRFTLGGGAWNTGSTTNGLLFERNGPFVFKPALAAWLCNPIASGIGKYWRMKGSVLDTDEMSYTVARMDGTVGELGSSAELQLESVVFELGTPKLLSNFFYTIPPIVGV